MWALLLLIGCTILNKNLAKGYEDLSDEDDEYETYGNYPNLVFTEQPRVKRYNGNNQTVRAHKATVGWLEVKDALRELMMGRNIKTQGSLNVVTNQEDDSGTQYNNLNGILDRIYNDEKLTISITDNNWEPIDHEYIRMEATKTELMEPTKTEFMETTKIEFIEQPIEVGYIEIPTKNETHVIKSNTNKFIEETEEIEYIFKKPTTNKFDNEPTKIDFTKPIKLPIDIKVQDMNAEPARVELVEQTNEMEYLVPTAATKEETTKVKFIEKNTDIEYVIDKLTNEPSTRAEFIEQKTGMEYIIENTNDNKEPTKTELKQPTRPALNRHPSIIGLNRQPTKSTLKRKPSRTGLNRQPTRTSLNNQRIRTRLTRKRVRTGLNRQPTKTSLNKQRIRTRLTRKRVRTGLNRQPTKTSFNKQRIRTRLTRKRVRTGLNRLPTRTALNRKPSRIKIKGPNPKPNKHTLRLEILKKTRSTHHKPMKTKLIKQETETTQYTFVEPTRKSYDDGEPFKIELLNVEPLRTGFRKFKETTSDPNEYEGPMTDLNEEFNKLIEEEDAEMDYVNQEATNEIIAFINREPTTKSKLQRTKGKTSDKEFSITKHTTHKPEHVFHYYDDDDIFANIEGTTQTDLTEISETEQQKKTSKGKLQTVFMYDSDTKTSAPPDDEPEGFTKKKPKGPIVEPEGITERKQKDPADDDIFIGISGPLPNDLEMEEPNERPPEDYEAIGISGNTSYVVNIGETKQNVVDYEVLTTFALREEPTKDYTVSDTDAVTIYGGVDRLVEYYFPTNYGNTGPVPPNTTQIRSAVSTWYKHPYEQTDILRWGKTKPPTTTARTSTKYRFDVEKFLDLVANLTYDYYTNLTGELNETLVRLGVPTCATPTTPTTETATPKRRMKPDYSMMENAIMGKCYVCGLEDEGIPRNARCSDAFATDFIPLSPVDMSAKGFLSKYKKYCRYDDVDHYVANATNMPRTIFGRWTGGCGVRWTDISSIYTQRTCRNRNHPTTGRHYASKRMAKLEMALANYENGCIVSPAASLIPLSRGISLYARFHACVCTGSWCNVSWRTDSDVWMTAVIVGLLAGFG